MFAMERISGPYKGFFIAAYTVETDGQFVGYAKVCVEEPRNVWDSGAVEKLASTTGCRSELEAVGLAERKAREAIADLLGSTDPITVPGALT
jgi:hypothetical protein